MHSVLTIIVVALSSWIGNLSLTGCETPPPTLIAAPDAPPGWYPAWSAEHYPSVVVASQDVISPELSLSGQDEQMAQLAGGSVLTFTWHLPLKSRVAIWLFGGKAAGLTSCEYSRVTSTHYIDLSSAPVYTTVMWLNMEYGWGHVAESYPPDLPFHRYVILTTSEPFYLDAVALLNPIFPVRRWMPIMMAQ